MPWPNRSQLTILTRILLASLLPGIFITVLIFSAIINLVYEYNERHIKDTVFFFTEHASEKITDSITHISSQLRYASSSIAGTYAESTPQPDSLERITRSLMTSNPEIYCAWFVLEANNGDAAPLWHARSFLHRNGSIREIPAIADFDLMSPDKAPWHYYPYTTDKPYFDLVDYWNYGINEGYEFIATVAYPVMVNGKTVGSVGIDVLYRSSMQFMDKWQTPDSRTVLLVADNGAILYSPSGTSDNQDVQSLPYAPEDAAAIGEALRSQTPLYRTIRSPITGQQSLAYLRSVGLNDDNHQLFLYVESPTNKLYAPADAILQKILAIWLVGLTLTAAGGFFITRTIVKPLRRLTNTADRIANGDLAITPADFDQKSGHGVEVDSLSASIRKMLEQLHQNHRLKLQAMEAEFERKKAEDSNQARTQFFASMSHEIRTPMNAIMGISDLLMSEQLTEQQKKYVKNIKASSESLLVIIDDILDIAKLEAGKLVLINAHFSLTRMLENITSICTYLTREKGLDFSMETEGDVPAYLYGDEVRLKQILLNLLGNAIKYTNEGSVRLKATTKDESLHFDVIDTGVGIKEEDRVHLFTAFGQVDLHKNRKIKGTGLGLSISMNLVKMMGGEITVSSTYGEGSVFQVSIPMMRGNPQQSGNHTEVIPRYEYNTNARILVVDDNDVNLQVAQGVMRLLGLECQTARSGMEALEKLGEEDYDLVFMDHMMPEMDGVETTLRIRQMGERYETLPVVALTANAVAGVREVLVESGMNDYLSKPIRKTELQKILAKWLPQPERATLVRPLDGHRGQWLIMARNIDGLDVDAGLNHVAGDMEAYQKLLRRTRDALPGLLESLDGKPSGNSAKNLEIDIMNVSADLAQIGARRISEEGTAIAKALLEEKASFHETHFASYTAAIHKMNDKLRALPL